MKKRWTRLLVLMVSASMVISPASMTALAGTAPQSAAAQKEQGEVKTGAVTQTREAVLTAETSDYDVSWYTSEQTAYTISTPAQLKGLAMIVNGYTDTQGAEHKADSMSGKTVTLGADLDMTGVVMDEAIGSSASNAFQGTFDGGGKKITNYTLAYKAAYSRIGLFGYVENAVIKNVDLSGSVTATGSGTYAGGIVGQATGSTITGCTFAGTIAGKSYGGGIVASVSQGTVSGCSISSLTLSTTGTYKGGIAGSIASGATVENCTNTANLSNAANQIGGIVGYMNASTILNCENTGTIKYTGTSSYGGYAGGIVGQMYGASTVLACRNSGQVNSAKKFAGGIAGQSSSASAKIKYCVNTGTVTSGTANSAGGIGGENIAIESSVTTTDKVFGNNTSSYTCKNTFCVAEGTSMIAGVTYCTEETLNTAATVTALNEGIAPLWKIGTAGYPVVNKAGVTGLYMVYDGKSRQYPAEFDGEKFVVTLPADTVFTGLTKENFVADALLSDTAVEFSAQNAEAGTWKMTAKNGSEKAEYTIQVNRTDKAWTPEISKDLNAKTSDIYHSDTLKSVKALEVAADIYDKGTLSYQWYQNTTNSTEGATPIAGANQSTYTPVVAAQDGKALFGTTYYFAEITNTLVVDGQKTSSAVNSAVKEVKVQYTVNYVDELVSANSRTEYVDYGQTAAPKTLKKDGQIFHGWYTSKDYKEEEAWNGETLTDDVTVYAYWEAIHYRVSLPESTEDYTVEPMDASVTDVLYDGEYAFKVTPKTEDGFVLVKANGARVIESQGVYKITDIREDQTVVVEYTKGVDANADGEYVISNEAELLSVLAKNPEKPVLKLASDISVTSGTMNTDKESPFNGVLDGQGHKITGLRGPLFGWIGESGVVKNLKVSGTLDIEANKIHYGESYASGGVTGVGMTCPDFLGAVAAVNYGLITGCTSDATLDSNDFDYADVWGVNDTTGLGGLVGNNHGIIEHCSFTGQIKAPSLYWGGMGGDSYGGIASSSTGIIRCCYNTGTITGGSMVGGIAGRLNDGAQADRERTAIVENCYNAGNVNKTGSMAHGAIVGCTGNATSCKDAQASLKNNYWLSGKGQTAGFDNDSYSSSPYKDEAMKQTADQMKGLELVNLLNKSNETSIYIKDLQNTNGGYPIFASQGTPVLTKENASVSFDGEAQAEMELTAKVDTKLGYTLEWLLCDENGFKVITTKDADGEDIPYTENKLPVSGDYVGKNLKVRVTSTEDGSSIVSETMGPVKPAPIKEIYFTDKPETLDMILDETTPDSADGNVELNVLTDPAESASLLDGEKISWSVEGDGVVSVKPAAETYDSTAEKPAAASVQAVGEGTATVKVTIGSFTASVQVRVHPAYVSTNLRVGDEMVPAETVAGTLNLSEIYGEKLAGAPKYVTPLSLFTSYVMDVLEKDPTAYVTLNEQNAVVSVNGETGNWVCAVDGKLIGAIDTSVEIADGADVTFFNRDAMADVDKIASFDKTEYTGFAGMDIKAVLSSSALAGEDINAKALPDAKIMARKEGAAEYAEVCVTGADGTAVLKFAEDGAYELTAVHTNADGKTDILKPFAKVIVKDKVAVTGLEMSEKARTMEAGTTCNLEAKVMPEDATVADIVYTSDNEKVAAVDEKGQVSAVAPGTAHITAAAKDNPDIRKTVEITVVKSVTEIRLNVSSATLKEGGSFQIKASVVPTDATNAALEYVSNKTSVATVDQNGKITARSVGETTIDVFAKDGSGVRATFRVKVLKKEVLANKITLNAPKVTLQMGKTWQIKPIVAPADVTNKNVVYRSSNTAVAKVDARGVIRAGKPGKAVITVTAADSSRVSARLTVTVAKPKVKMNAKTVPLKVKQTTKVLKIKSSTSGQEKIKSAVSSRKSIVKVSVKKGVLTLKAGKKLGKAVITITSTNGAKTKVTVKVQKQAVKTKKLSMEKKALTLRKGKKATLKVVRNPISSTDKLTWYSSKRKVVSVNKKGVVKGLKKGTATITVKTANGKRATCKVTVK